MKKFIAIAAALVSFGAFADHHMENRHMVTLSGWEDAATSDLNRSLDIGYNHTGGASHSTRRNIALNYAYAINGMWQVGGEYAMWNSEGANKASTDSMRYGIFAIYNFKGQLHNTNYLGLKYSMMNKEVEDNTGTTSDADTTMWTLEFGHRFSLGTLWGMNYNWSPSISVTKSDLEDDKKSPKEDYSSTNVALNVLKVDILF